MAIGLKSFTDAAASSRLGWRSLIVREASADVVLGHLGHGSLSDRDKALNAATLRSFRSALEAAHGIFGTEAFDRVLGDRLKAYRPLRVRDVRRILDEMPEEKLRLMLQELTRLSETLPGLRSYSENQRMEIRREAADVLNGNLQRRPDLLANCRTVDELSARAELLLNDAVGASPLP